MNVNLNVVIGGEVKTVVAKPYAFPKTPKVPEGYTLTLGGEAATLAKTGGGEKYPTYVYVMLAEGSYYLPKNVTPDSGTDLVRVEAPKPAEEVKVEESVVAAPKRVRGKRAA